MRAVIEHGTRSLTTRPGSGRPEKMGTDETSWLKANPSHRTLYASGMVDLDAGIIIDLVKRNTSPYAILARGLRPGVAG